MGLILSLETATAVCSVALHQDGELIGIIELFQQNVHAQKLMPIIDALFTQTGIDSQKLDAVAVSSGPGSYTGLRVGVSTAKGLAYAMDIPLIGVDTLDALAQRILPFVKDPGVIIPLIDARRMEVYCKVLNARMEEFVPLTAQIIDESSFGQYLRRGKIYFVGDCINKVRGVIRDHNALFIPYLNSSETIGELAEIKFQKKEFEDLAYFEPNYLKEFKVLKPKKTLLS